MQPDTPDILDPTGDGLAIVYILRGEIVKEKAILDVLEQAYITYVLYVPVSQHGGHH